MPIFNFLAWFTTAVLFVTAPTGQAATVLVAVASNFTKPMTEIAAEFEKATIAIRNNFDYKTYDAAQAAIYDKPGIVELVRIYDRKADLSKLQSLQQKYIIEVERK